MRRPEGTGGQMYKYCLEDYLPDFLSKNDFNMGKYLKLFANHTAYSQAESSLDKPNVAVCQQEGDVHYNPYDPFNGHAYVDLGLPSGTKWATMNVGASDITDYGNYYMYGMGSKTYDSTDTPYAGDKDPLPTSADTAAQEWGGEWHMPTRAQMEELTANTTYEWVTNYKGSGINGGLFTAQNGNYIFLPASGEWFNGNPDFVGDEGYYWSSSPSRSDSAYCLGFGNAYTEMNSGLRKGGCSVRPVVDGNFSDGGNYSDGGAEGDDEIIG